MNSRFGRWSDMRVTRIKKRNYYEDLYWAKVEIANAKYGMHRKKMSKLPK